MDIRTLIITNITEHLIKCGLDEFRAKQCAAKSFTFYQKEVGNSKDPYKQACDHAGQLACGMVPKFKYKSPSNRAKRQTKRPQDVFDF